MVLDLDKQELELLVGALGSTQVRVSLDDFGGEVKDESLKKAVALRDRLKDALKKASVEEKLEESKE